MPKWQYQHEQKVALPIRNDYNLYCFGVKIVKTNRGFCRKEIPLDNDTHILTRLALHGRVMRDAPDR